MKTLNFLTRFKLIPNAKTYDDNPYVVESRKSLSFDSKGFLEKERLLISHNIISKKINGYIVFYLKDGSLIITELHGDDDVKHSLVAELNRLRLASIYVLADSMLYEPIDEMFWRKLGYAENTAWRNKMAFGEDLIEIEFKKNKSAVTDFERDFIRTHRDGSGFYDQEIVLNAWEDFKQVGFISFEITYDGRAHINLFRAETRDVAIKILDNMLEKYVEEVYTLSANDMLSDCGFIKVGSKLIYKGFQND